MAQTPGSRLLDLLTQEWVTAARDAASRLTGPIGSLAPDPAFDGTAFSGRILGPLEDVAADPILAVVGALRAGSAPGPRVAVHGWRDTVTEGAPRGLALVITSGGPDVLALTTVPPVPTAPTEPATVVLRAAGLAGGVTLTLATGSALRLSGTTAAEVAVRFAADGTTVPSGFAPGDRVELALDHPGPGPLWGVPGGPSVRLGEISFGAVVSGAVDGIDRSAQLRLAGGEAALVPGFLAAFLPAELADLTVPLDLDVRAQPGTGVTLGGSPSLAARLPGAGVARWLDLEVAVVDAAPGLGLTFATSLDLELPGVPVHLRVDGVGLGLDLPLRPGPGFAPRPEEVRGAEPSGAEVSLDVPVVSGSGTLVHRGTELLGALSVDIPPLSASAFAALAPADGQGPLSLLVILGATFPPPGIQIGLGFAVTGVGGVVGINRRVDRDALLRAVADGSVGGLLFPADPVRTGEDALRALPAVFPRARGSVVAGPMFQIGWGRIITLSVAVIAESGAHGRVTILGTVVIALPDPLAPLVLIRATVAGLVEPSVPSVTVVAGLAGSHIVGAPLTGDLLVLTRGGADPALVISAGGFHPAFPLPPGVPALRRLAVDLSPIPWLQLRCEAYVAVTSTTLQLGARLELVAEVAGCGLRGWLGFDALIGLDPFRFVADVSGGLALRAFGTTLVGVQVALHLEGPAPYLARGRGSIDVFLFEVSLDFEVGWGRPAAPLDPAPDVGRELRAALADRAAWRTRGTAPRGVVLTARAQRALAEADVVDPYGSVTAQQTRVPLAVHIQRLDGRPVPPQRWDIAEAVLREGEPARTDPVRLDFPPGQFLAPATDDEAFAAPAFLPLVAGATLSPQPATGAERRPVDLTWEERVIVRDVPTPVTAEAGLTTDLTAVSALLVSATTADDTWWQVPDAVVEVLAAPPAAAATTWAMGTASQEPLMTVLEMDQLIGGAADLMTVEAWEVGVR